MSPLTTVIYSTERALDLRWLHVAVAIKSTMTFC